jgi:D-arabinose 1-dehydrogenase
MGGSELMRCSILISIAYAQLSYGICAIDTSAYYATSEIVLGEILKAVADEFPRETYKIVSQRDIRLEEVGSY